MSKTRKKIKAKPKATKGRGPTSEMYDLIRQSFDTAKKEDQCMIMVSTTKRAGGTGDAIFAAYGDTSEIVVVISDLMAQDKALFDIVAASMMRYTRNSVADFITINRDDKTIN